jgi:hypothetical protein
MLADVRRILIGAPLPSARLTHERLSKIQALVEHLLRGEV